MHVGHISSRVSLRDLCLSSLASKSQYASWLVVTVKKVS